MSSESNLDIEVDVCPRCGEPAKKISMPLGGRNPVVIYQCDQCYAREVEGQKKGADRKRVIKVQRNIQEAQLPEVYFDFQIRSFPQDSENQKQIIQAVQKYIDNWRGSESLILSGNIGTGKTTLATLVAKALINFHLISAMFTTPTTYAREISVGSINGKYSGQEIIWKARRVGLFILDDFGLDKREFVLAAIYDILDHRHRNGKSSIITSNVNIMAPDAPALIRRLASRFNQRGNTLLVFNGNDLRMR